MHCVLLLLLLTATAAAAGTRQRHTHHSRPLSVDAIKRREALHQHIQLLLKKCPLPGYCVRDAGLPTAAEYLTEPGDLNMKQQKQKVADFISGPGFKARLNQLRGSPDGRGILISAGKPHHVGTMTIMLHILRHHHNCSLPVEVAYQGDSEVDPTTRATLSSAFPPLHWLDLQQQQYPTHHNQEYVMDRYEPKIYALYHTRFQQVLLLDADNLPLRDPTRLFSSPHMTTAGVMMWLDLWSPTLSSTTFIGHDSVYPLVGLRKQPYWVALSGGLGHVSRVAESGQVLLDRVRHADVLEYLWWITSHSKVVYRHILGDKDTFGYAFAAAGKLHEYSAVAVPPGAAFRLKKQQQHSNSTAAAEKVWRFMGMLQYDHLGSPAFFHRTFEKWEDVTSRPPEHVEVLTGPLPNWFIMSYLGNKTTGLTPELPQHTLRPAHMTTGFTSSSGSSSSHGEGPITTYLDSAKSYVRAMNTAGDVRLGACPIQMYLDYQRLRHWGLPVSKQQGLLRTCQRVAAGSSSSRNHDSSNGSAYRSSSLWPWLGEQSWLRNCRALRQQQQQGSSKGHSSGNRYDDDDDDDARFITNHKLLEDQPGAVGSAGGGGGGGGGGGVNGAVGHRVTGKNDQLPRCDLVDWHVARFALSQYAEEIGTDTSGHSLPLADPRLPVLRLLPQQPAAAPTASAAAHTAEKKAAGLILRKSVGTDAVKQKGVQSFNARQTSGDANSQHSGYISVLDEVQQQAIPAALHWVGDNMVRLPIFGKKQ